MKWNTAKFHQLTPDRLYDILKFRVDIFVVEQKCAYPELDDKDRHVETRHITAYDDSRLIAYTRLLPPGLSYPDVSVGRFAIEPSARDQGTGSLLMERTLEEIDKIWPGNETIQGISHEKLSRNLWFRTSLLSLK